MEIKMTEQDAITIDIDNRGVATVTLNRPHIHNAFDDTVIVELINAFEFIHQNNDVRVMVLAATGKSFCAGADLNWMKKMASYSYAENRQDAEQLAKLFSTLYNLNKPTIARVQGAVYGGGVGLVACCDIAIGSKLSKFCLSEVKLGLVPATISPYVIEAIGPRLSKRYFMTAEVMSALRARRIGLLSEVVSEEELESSVESVILPLLNNGPSSVAIAKQLVNKISYCAIDEKLIDETSDLIASVRVSDEGQEGLTAFLEKRTPNWKNV